MLEEKCTAIEMVICYARELGAEFDRYVDVMISIVVPLLKFYFHDGVRFAAAAVIPQLFEAMKKANAGNSLLVTRRLNNFQVTMCIFIRTIQSQCTLGKCLHSLN